MVSDLIQHVFGDWSRLVGLWEMFLAAPLPTILLLAFLFMLARPFLKAEAKAASRVETSHIAGWRKPAKERVQKDGVRKHIMKPETHFILLITCLLFFGVGGMFVAISTFPDPDSTWKDWGIASIGPVFGLVSLIFLWRGFVRISYTEDQISRRAPFVRRFEAGFEELVRVEPCGKYVVHGVRLIFADGRRLKVMADYSGYRDLLEFLGRFDPKIRLLARMADPLRTA